MTSSDHSTPGADGMVLSTLRQDGSRRKLYPRLASGRFLLRRRVIAYALIALFVAIPHIEAGGKPLILLDLAHREFTFFGHTFLPTDTILLMFLGLSIAVTILFLTALFGRVWCGWACPQTVYMEFFYRPFERLFEGNAAQQKKIDRGAGWRHPRRLLKNLTFLVISFLVANVFLAYFVSVDTLFEWIQLSPAEHPTAFLIMAGVTGLMFFDFAYFREQTCLIACPYGRLQSVLVDKSSLIVGYDYERGEPRGKLKKKLPMAGDKGDCIDCKACVHVCPTGIDIRDGLQMECITCTQCIDACDAIMDKIDKPRGLIRYCSEDELAGRPRVVMRPRVIIYPALLAAALGAFIYFLGAKPATQLKILRTAAPFTQFEDGRVSNQVLLKITNKTDAARRYRIELDGAPDAEFIAPTAAIELAPYKSITLNLIVNSEPDRYQAGRRAVQVRVIDDQGAIHSIDHILLGPVKEGAL